MVKPKVERDGEARNYGRVVIRPPHPHLDVRGEGPVTAADIQVPAEVEIVNPDLYLFTVDDSRTRFELDMTVERGRGDSPAADRSGRLPIGELPVDAIYSPGTRVNINGPAAR